MKRVKSRWVLVLYDSPQAIFNTEAEAERIADFLNEGHDSRPYWVTEVVGPDNLFVVPDEEVIAAQARISGQPT